MASFRDADAIVGTGRRGYGTDEVDMRREKGSQTRHMNVHGYLTGMVVVQAQGAAHCSILWKLETCTRVPPKMIVRDRGEHRERALRMPISAPRPGPRQATVRHRGQLPIRHFVSPPSS